MKSFNEERLDLMRRDPGPPQPRRPVSPEFLAERRAKMPKNEAGECLCKAGHLVPDGQLHCETCDDEHRRAYERDKLVFDLRHAFARCNGHREGQVYDDEPSLPNWPWARLDNQAFRDAVSPKFLKAVERWDGRTNLALAGSTGKGKTSLVVAKIHALWGRAIEAAGRGEKPERPPSFTFTSALDLVAARRTHKLGSAEPKLIDTALTGSGLLIVDEIGFEDQRDQLILEVADSRDKRGLLTVITTGKTRSEFATRYGAAVWRRFTESGHVIEDFDEPARPAASAPPVQRDTTGRTGWEGQEKQ